jgi:hypothetical protein
MPQTHKKTVYHDETKNTIRPGFDQTTNGPMALE